MYIVDYMQMYVISVCVRLFCCFFPLILCLNVIIAHICSFFAFAFCLRLSFNSVQLDVICGCSCALIFNKARLTNVAPQCAVVCSTRADTEKTHTNEQKKNKKEIQL